MKTSAPFSHGSREAFTLIEMLLAAAAGAMIMAVVATIYWRAVHTRNQATDRTHESRVQARAVAVLRDDLRQARISGGLMAATLESYSTATHSRFKGDLRFTTTSGAVSEAGLGADLQEVEYYINDDPAGGDGKSGVLTRAVNRTLLAPSQPTVAEEPLLTGVESMEVSFFDGSSWQDTWQLDTTAPTVPKGIRVRIILAANDAAATARTPLEVLVPWSSDLAIDTTSTTTASGTTAGGTP